MLGYAPGGVHLLLVGTPGRSHCLETVALIHIHTASVPQPLREQVHADGERWSVFPSGNEPLAACLEDLGFAQGVP